MPRTFEVEMPITAIHQQTYHSVREWPLMLALRAAQLGEALKSVGGLKSEAENRATTTGNAAATEGTVAVLPVLSVQPEGEESLDDLFGDYQPVSDESHAVAGIGEGALQPGVSF